MVAELFRVGGKKMRSLIPIFALLCVTILARPAAGQRLDSDQGYDVRLSDGTLMGFTRLQRPEWVAMCAADGAWGHIVSVTKSNGIKVDGFAFKPRVGDTVYLNEIGRAHV